MTSESPVPSPPVEPATGPREPSPTQSGPRAPAEPRDCSDRDEAPREGPLRVGVLSSPGYQNQRGGLELVRGFLATRADVPHHEVRDPDQVRKAIGSMAADGLDVLVVNGGDGTLSMVLTSLFRHRSAEERPLLAVLAGGRTNMSAGDVGMPGNQVRSLRRLLAWAETGGRGGEVLRRPVIQLERGGGEPALYGLFMGAGAVYHASLSTWRFRDASSLPGMRTGLGTATNVVRLLVAHLFRRSAFPASGIQLQLDGRELTERSWCVAYVTTLDRMALGLRPFWGTGPGPLHLAAIANRHVKLLRAAWSGLRGRTNRHLGEANGYYSANVRRLELIVDDGVTLDGEVVLPVSGAPLILTAEEDAGFVRP